MQKLPFLLAGSVVSGKQLGRTLGFPTANIAYSPDERIFPSDGVYLAAVTVEENGACYPAILNQGRHPTVPDGPPTIEAHLLGCPADENLYGKELKLCYLRFLRPEVSFPTLDHLRRQLEADRMEALAHTHEYPDFFRK